MVLALNGDSAYVDWRSSSLLDVGVSFLSKWPLWSVSFIPRRFNSVAHSLAKWAAFSDFSGYLPPHLLPASVVQATGDVFVNSDVVLDDVNEDG